MTNIQTDGQTLTLHFRTAFPLPLTVPLIADSIKGNSPYEMTGQGIEAAERALLEGLPHTFLQAPKRETTPQEGTPLASRPN